MQLLQKIIDTLSDEKGSLTDALLKTKVVMHQIGHAELSKWVSNELNGYDEDAELPDYRKISGRIFGELHYPGAIRKDYPLVIGHLPKKIVDPLIDHDMTDSISVLEKYATASGLRVPVPPEYFGELSEAYQNATVQAADLRIEPLQVLEILTKIRSRLLDFALQLKDKIGNAEGGAELRDAAKGIDAAGMFHNAVIGDNATFIIGSSNTTTINNAVKKGSFESLAALLKQRGVQERDISALQTAIAADAGAVDVANKKFGPAVKKWMGNMMQKAAETAWSIELGIAGNLLTDALKAFYFS